MTWVGHLSLITASLDSDTLIKGGGFAFLAAAFGVAMKTILAQSGQSNTTIAQLREERDIAVAERERAVAVAERWQLNYWTLRENLPAGTPVIPLTMPPPITLPAKETP